MLRAYKYRIYPNADQARKIEQHFGSCRLVWNLALAAKKQAYESSRINLSRYDLQKQLIDLKESYPWLYNTNAQSLQSVLLDLDNAYKGFFNKGGFPKFKKKSGHQSFQCPQNVQVVSDLLIIPKIKNIPIRLSRQFEGKIKTVTISKTPTGKYFASVLVETNQNLPVKPAIIPQTTVGVDLGIKSFVITSDGRKFEPNRKLKNSLQRLKVLSRRVSRKKKGSGNRKKAIKQLSTLHEKITNQRTDYIHKITHALTHDNQVDSIVVEKLNVVGMLKNRKLSQSISDVSFGEFIRQLKYKCDWYGKNFIQIGTFEPSSKTCSNCKSINQELTLAHREWTCHNCGTIHDRDYNAAMNIKEMGLEKTILNNQTGAGSSGEPAEKRRLRRSKKQEVSK